MKTCSKCKVEKEISDFYRDKTKKDGHKYSCKDCRREYTKKYLKVYRSTEDYREYKRRYNNYYRNSSKERKISIDIRTCLWQALKNNSKSGKAVERLGCSITKFKKYLEKQFQPGMSWDNWGRNGWQLDHKRPVSSFDLSKESEILKACHYTNIQPLWAHENRRKGMTF